MDIVRAVMDRLKGTVSVRSTAGEGSTFKLEMPLTLAIIKALFSASPAESTPCRSATSSRSCAPSTRKSTASTDRRCCGIREEVVPLIRSAACTAGAVRPSKWFVVVVTLGERKAGLVVDQLVGEQEW